MAKFVLDDPSSKDIVLCSKSLKSSLICSQCSSALLGLNLTSVPLDPTAHLLRSAILRLRIDKTLLGWWIFCNLSSVCVKSVVAVVCEACDATECP